MATFERRDPEGDLNTGKSRFNIVDQWGGQAQLTQEEANGLMNWLRSFLDPLPSLAETHQACICAQEQAMHDIPYVEVGEARPFQYHYKSGRLYVEVDLTHHDPDQGAAIALYRVWRLPDGSLAAFKVDIKESEG